MWRWWTGQGVVLWTTLVALGCGTGSEGGVGVECDITVPCPIGSSCLSGQCVLKDSIAGADSGSPAPRRADGGGADGCGSDGCEDIKEVIDRDGDGIRTALDCDDTEPAVGRSAVRPCASKCAIGVERCVDGVWLECNADRTCGCEPTPEICNGVDDDCDGAVDEAIARGCSSACGLGTQVCGSGIWGTCSARVPSIEICNGRDDDCDGSIDEALIAACATTCGSGTSVCRSGSWGACSAPLPSVEDCNGVDDDCDGRVDEELTRECESRCGPGTQTCSRGTWGLCSTRSSTSVETCNFVDDDCDGIVDEGYTYCGFGDVKYCAGNRRPQRCEDGSRGSCTCTRDGRWLCFCGPLVIREVDRR